MKKVGIWVVSFAWKLHLFTVRTLALSSPSISKPLPRRACGLLTIAVRLGLFLYGFRSAVVGGQRLILTINLSPSQTARSIPAPARAGLGSTYRLANAPRELQAFPPKDGTCPKAFACLGH